VFSQQEERIFYDDLSYFSHPSSEEKTIEEIVSLQDNGVFFKKEKTTLYEVLGDRTWWYRFKLNPNKDVNPKYFSISLTYLEYGKVYIKTGEKIDSLYQTSYNENFPHKFIFYRNPVWKIPIDSLAESEVFFKLKNKSGRTRLEFYLETENEFLERVETEYIFFGLFIAFLISITLILVFFSVLKKEYIVLFYAFYILTALIEFLAGKGLGVQFLWSDSYFLVNSFRSLSQTLGTLLLGLFFMNFYQLGKARSISKNIFKWGAYATIPLLVIYAYKFVFGGFESFYLYVWLILKIIVFVWVLNHLYLAIKKQIPIYLMIAFILPIIAVINGQSMNPDVHSTLAVKLSGPNIYYITLGIEMVLFTWYIFGSIIDTQQQYFKLKKVNDELKYNFQNKTLEVQQKERNKLLSNVHDSFGGYLEALKLRLLQKNDNTPEKIQEILDAFNKDYRYLLNNLYSPKINADNFIENLTEYCEKIDNLVSEKIECIFSIKNVELSQEKCVHLYRIISELTTNAIKYANASVIKIIINDSNNKVIQLQVSDNGVGFDTEKRNQNSYGLKNITERVELMKGQLQIDSQKDKGTNITITIPEND